jgi:hypothetical protein
MTQLTESRFEEEDTMSSHCGCGASLDNSLHSFACLDCGSSVCRGCAITLESATYCTGCAAALLETTTVRAGSAFELH